MTGAVEAPTLDVERRLAAQGYDLIVGFDEVGRGALAGPVMVGAAAVWARDLPDLAVPNGVADSKLLTERRREALFDPLRDWCAAYAVGRASNTEIDEWGISHALGVAALRALDDLERQVLRARAVDDTDDDGGVRMPRIGAILDGPNDYITKTLNTFDAPAVPIVADVVTQVKADRRCATVSAASIIAKVTRDRLMADLAASDPRYAPYGWERNKGYGSAAHRNAIVRYGETSLHRHTWHLV